MKSLESYRKREGEQVAPINIVWKIFLSYLYRENLPTEDVIASTFNLPRYS